MPEVLELDGEKLFVTETEMFEMVWSSLDKECSLSYEGVWVAYRCCREGVKG
jgi:hypothetical protein